MPMARKIHRVRNRSRNESFFAMPVESLFMPESSPLRFAGRARAACRLPDAHSAEVEIGAAQFLDRDAPEVLHDSCVRIDARVACQARERTRKECSRMLVLRMAEMDPPAVLALHHDARPPQLGEVGRDGGG